jgi:hypothetical protein
MKYIYIFFLLFLISFLGCDSNSSENIILTSGLSENLNEPRFGIEINKKELYYCIENAKRKGTYDYFIAKIKSDDFIKIKKRIELHFANKIKLRKIYDATPYCMYYNFNNKIDSVRFYYSFLNDQQFKLIEDIKELKNRKFTRIKFHNFPKKLLTEKLPEPPAVPSIR